MREARRPPAPADPPAGAGPAGGDPPASGGDRRAGLGAELASLRIDRAAEEAAASPCRRRPLVLAALAAAVALAALWLAHRAAGERAIAVELAPATAGPAGEPVRAPVLTGMGYVVTGEKYIAIGVRVAGRIERYFVEEGQSVRAGDPLVQLDDRDYRARLDRARASLARARADLALRQTELGRGEALFASGVIARQELDERRSRVAVDRARIGEIEAEIAQAEVELDYTVLRAPRAGVVLAKLKEVGEIAVPGGFAGSGDLVRMASLEDMRAEVDVNESDLHRVRMGQPAEVLPDAYPDRVYPARVVKLYPQVNRQKGTLKIEVHIPEPDAMLLPDMSVRVSFLGEAAPAAPGVPAVTIPLAALRRDGDRPYVWVADGGRAHRRAVTLGADLGARVQVTAGLAGGESLVVGDAAGLREGAPVRRAAPGAG